MKKGLLIIASIMLLAGCENKETNNEVKKPDEISYTNKFE